MKKFVYTACMRNKPVILLPVIACTLLLCGCAVLRNAVMGNVSTSLAQSAAASFSSESDLVLAAGALPFALKTLDMLAREHPGDPAIQLAAGRAYIQYAGGFLDWEARKAEFTDVDEASRLHQRAARLHARGRDYAAAALNIKHADGMQRLKENPDHFLRSCRVGDVPELFWLASGWAAGIASDPSNMREFAQLGLVESIMRRCLELAPDYDDGSIHEFFLVYEATRNAAAGRGDKRAERDHFDKAVAASQGKRASPFVLMATSMMIPAQDVAGFRDMMNKALAIPLDDVPENRLANAIAQDKARWYLENIEAFFLLDEAGLNP